MRTSRCLQEKRKKSVAEKKSNISKRLCSFIVHVNRFWLKIVEFYFLDQYAFNLVQKFSKSV